MIIIKKNYHKEKAYNDGTTAYNDKPTAYNNGTTAYNNKPTAYIDGTTSYNDKPTVYNKYYHIRQLWRSIQYHIPFSLWRHSLPNIKNISLITEYKTSS